MEKKMDTNDIWLQSLELLFAACVPLTWDCRRTAEAQSEIIKTISNYSYYCDSVRRAISVGKTPQTWDEWNANKISVEGQDAHLDPINTSEFEKILTDIFK